MGEECEPAVAGDSTLFSEALAGSENNRSSPESLEPTVARCRGLFLLALVVLGFRSASPQALRCRPLRGLRPPQNRSMQKAKLEATMSCKSCLFT